MLQTATILVETLASGPQSQDLGVSPISHRIAIDDQQSFSGSVLWRRPDRPQGYKWNGQVATLLVTVNFQDSEWRSYRGATSCMELLLK